jgi:pantetheine-phosphate adenylyltransferase
MHIKCMKRKAIYPGTFDPITKGHIDLVERGLSLFDEITIVVATNLRKSSAKSDWFTPQERKAMIASVFKKQKRVKVDFCDSLIMEYARKNQVQAVLRGMRATSDFESEFMMAAMNKEINAKVETVFMLTSKDLFFVSSSMVKELAAFGGDVTKYVPQLVAKKLEQKVKGM